MPAVIMDGREVSAHLKPYIRAHATELIERYRYVPALAAIIAGSDPASSQYVKNKRRFAEELGFRSRIIKLAADASADRLRETIERLNADPVITGILLQLPLAP